MLLAGPTASGKTALAIAIAAAQGRDVVNADALQAWADWRILTARPSPAEEAAVPHHLYGHLGWDEDWSVGHWLRGVAPFLQARPAPVIVGGTGLAFAALTEGLAEIPAIPEGIRAEARAAPAEALLAQLDERTKARIDTRNPARTRRAWEVLRATGRPLADWQDETPPPLLPPARAAAFRIDAPPQLLNARIEARFDAMISEGALEEVGANLLRDPSRPAAAAIAAPELSAHLRGEMTLAEARDRAVAATRRYAKRQRTWARARMGGWTPLPLS
ncbi:tRNA (adenosine(37)-N6)-dimethylallyltransferase MiaA [Hasllibacter halocynthiae]|uniref:tRNA (adenosine(37)-N6)-dimethylallyltransferase MiaA n=1 Tax=Hasllibacter halocynthiae TaxID=595589 RepID=UPI0026A09631